MVKDFEDRMKQLEEDRAIIADATQEWIETNGFFVPDSTDEISTRVFTTVKNPYPAKPSWEDFINEKFPDAGIKNYSRIFTEIRWYLMVQGFYIVQQNIAGGEDAKYSGWGEGSPVTATRVVVRKSNYGETLFKSVIDELTILGDLSTDWEDEEALENLNAVLDKRGVYIKALKSITGEDYTPDMFQIICQQKLAQIRQGKLSAGNDNQ